MCIFVLCMLSVNNDCCVEVINKPCARIAEYMRLISWTRHRACEHYGLCIKYLGAVDGVSSRYSGLNVQNGSVL
jgi:hypothetical protein